MDNIFIETFNGSLRDECLNLHWFATVTEEDRHRGVARDYNQSVRTWLLATEPYRDTYWAQTLRSRRRGLQADLDHVIRACVAPTAVKR